MAEELPCLRRQRRPGNIAEVAVSTLQGEAFQFGDNFINDRITDYGSSRRATRLDRVSDRQQLQGEYV